MTSLAKINVICGTNNSGKTTLLERIASCENVALGEDFVLHADQETLTTAFRKLRVNLARIGDVNFLSFFQKATDLDETWRKTVDDFPVIFNDDAVALGQLFLENAVKVAERIKGSRSLGFDLTSLCQIESFSSKVQDALASVFLTSFVGRIQGSISKDSVIFVSPKRHIASETKIEVRSEVGYEGDGLIQRLFFLKSKLPETDERRLFENYWAAFQEVTGTHKFDIEIDAQSQTLKLYFSAIDVEEWRFADDCGLGLRELMVILYYALESKTSLILIEEPENHLHPEMQRRLLWFLKERTAAEKQFILTTHSSVFLDTSFVDRIFQTSLVNREITINDASRKAKLLNDLGYSVSDNLVSDLVIIVEGSSDKEILTDFLRRKNLFGKFNIKFWILNGDAMGNVDLHGLADRYSIKVLLDHDPSSAEARKSFLRQCKELGIQVTKLKRYSIENYFPLELYRESLGADIPKKITSLNQAKPVWAQLGSKIKKKSIKKGARKFAERTPLDLIEGTDLGDFLSEIETILTSHKINRET